MKKLLIFLVMMSLMIAPMVMADLQDVFAGVSENIEFTLISTSVNYGSIIPGGNSAVQANQIKVNDSTNVNFSIYISLEAGSDDLFKNIYFDLNNNADYELNERLDDVSLVWSITDKTGEFFESINSRLSVPIEQTPISASGKIKYTVTGPAPII